MNKLRQLFDNCFPLPVKCFILKVESRFLRESLSEGRAHDVSVIYYSLKYVNVQTVLMNRMADKLVT
jgi:hypothetical protein